VPVRVVKEEFSRTTKFYVVRRGRMTGLFYTWPDCESQVKGFSNAEFKSFKVKEDALRYLGF
jgi:viroplasmin and RNaseH domain-containing protein